MMIEYEFRVSTGWEVEPTFGTPAEAWAYARDHHLDEGRKITLVEHETRRRAYRLNSVPDGSEYGQLLVRELKRKLAQLGETALAFTCTGRTLEQILLARSLPLLQAAFPDCDVTRKDYEIQIAYRND